MATPTINPAAMNELCDALRDALRQRNATLPIAIIRYEDGEFEALPSVLRSDISWSGYRESYTVILSLDADDLEMLADYASDPDTGADNTQEYVELVMITVDEVRDAVTA